MSIPVRLLDPPDRAREVVRDVRDGALAGAVVFTAYVLTLAPGLLAVRDTPAFQYMGRVLGVPHQPGYPLYVLVSHVFSALSIGSLAFRMNLLSAVFGAATVSLVFLVLRRAAVRREFALGTALSTGLGQVVWSQSVIAEIYSLETLLIAAALLALLIWRDGRRARTYYAAMFLWGLVFGHHTSDATLAPAVLVFVWLVDRRWLLRPRTVLLSAAAGLLAFAPYSLLVIRTYQQAPYVLEPARSLGDLARIITGFGYRESLFAFSPVQVITERIPLAWSLVAAEMTWPMCAVAVVGGLAVARTRDALGRFVVAGIAAQVAFVVNYDIPDIAVFFIPTFALVWLLAGLGLQAIADLRIGGRSWPGVPLVIAAALPAWLVLANFAAVDQSWNIGTDRYMRALVDGLPARSVFLNENWVADQVVRYLTLGEGLPDGKVIVGPTAADYVTRQPWRSDTGPVFAFIRTAQALRVAGFPIVRERVKVPLDTFLRAQFPGTIVALAVPASISHTVGMRGHPLFARVGGTQVRGGQSTPAVAVGVVGSRGRPLERLDSPLARIALHDGTRIGSTVARAPSAIEVRAGIAHATVTVDGREVASSQHEAIVAMWDPSGRFRGAWVAEGGAGAPTLFEPLVAYRLDRDRRCLALPARPAVDLAPESLPPLMALNLPPGSSVLFDVDADSTRADPRVVDWIGRAKVTVSAAPGGSTRFASAIRIESAEDHEATSWILVSLGAHLRRAQARVDVPGGRGLATVCAVELGGLLRPLGEHEFELGVANDEQSLALGKGWGKAEGSAAGPTRQMAGQEATAFVALPAAEAWRIRVTARTPSGAFPTPRAIGLRVNGLTFPRQAVRSGWQQYEWTAAKDVLRPLTEIAILTFRETNTDLPSTHGMVIGSLTFRNIGR